MENLSIRLIQSHDIKENWDKLEAFIPSAGEFIVYDPDASVNITRYKVGDGKTKLLDLPLLTGIPVTEETIFLDGGRI
jgi:hypothetical protein